MVLLAAEVFHGGQRQWKRPGVWSRGLPVRLWLSMEQIKNATGLDIFDILQGKRGAITELQR
jgi:hypothetical protein